MPKFGLLSIFLVVASLFSFAIPRISAFNMYLLVYSNQKIIQTSVKDASNLDLYYNYSIIQNDYYLKHRLSFRGINLKGGNPFDRESLGLQTSIYHHFYKADVSKYGLYYPTNFTRIARQHWNFANPPEINHSLIAYKKIVLGFSHHSEYGHFLQDMLCPIISMPIEITADAEIYVQFNENQAKNFFNFLGYDADRVHQLTDKWVHGSEVFCAVSEFGINSNFQSWNELHDMIQRKYNLEKIRPTQHTAINKHKGNWGRVGNMEDLFKIAKERYPKYNWVYYPEETLYNLTLSVKILAATNLYLSAAGSACFNCIYMHRNTHVLFFTRYITDNPAIASAFTLGIYIYGICNRNLGNVKVDDFVNGLNEIMYVIEHGKWKDGIEGRSGMIFKSSDYQKGLKLYQENNRTNIFTQVVKRIQIPYRIIMCDIEPTVTNTTSSSKKTETKMIFY